MPTSSVTHDLELIKLRRSLHAAAELADEEQRTAALVCAFLGRYPPDALYEGIGGHGVAAVYRGAAPGPTVVLRAELDAVPVDETIEVDHGATAEGASHKCGHDGHMAMLCGVAARLASERPERGRAVLLFQAAEETGRGAQRMLHDDTFGEIAPDWIFALHNLPGFARGQVVVRAGDFTAASKGLVVELSGTSAHAAEPHKGTSPALAVAQLIQGFAAMSQEAVALSESAKVTTIYARLGEVAFGTSPSKATVMATLRALREEVMEELSERCVHLIAGIGATWNLETDAFWTEVFPTTVNDPLATRIVTGAAASLGLEVVEPEHPFPWSEDFGHFTAVHRGALVGIGAGEEQAALHHPDYDFPDELIGTGVALLEEILRGAIESGAHSLTRLPTPA